MAASRQSFLIDPQGVLRKVYNPVNIFTHADEVLSDLQTLTEVIDQLGSLQRRQREMQDSITAARRIQQSLLPDLSSIENSSGQIALMFEPLDQIGVTATGYSPIPRRLGWDFLTVQDTECQERSSLWSCSLVSKG